MSNDHPHISNNHETSIEVHLDHIQQEFRRGFEFLEKYPRSVTVFGSSMALPTSEHYKNAYELAKKIVTDTKYTIVSGGGPGIMEASSKGATEAGGLSIGLRINLLRKRNPNIYTSDNINFTYFFARKTMLTFAAEAYVFFPGGFGTFDELFSILTLIQTNRIPRVPIILFGSSFWNPLKDFMEKQMLGEKKTINYDDLNLFEITDSYDRAVEIIKKAPTSEWWKNIN
ncbi:MAG: TIGR00730 family Rossman fold protein [Candidatus Taylorbacteria bacterium]|nr:TIGR00730 family Rossman fold protein [Candidatus Taylorbacteria bacterium]